MAKRQLATFELSDQAKTLILQTREHLILVVKIRFCDPNVKR